MGCCTFLLYCNCNFDQKFFEVQVEIKELHCDFCGPIPLMNIPLKLLGRVKKVPLVLMIRLVSLKGTAVFKLKALPFDRV